MLNRDELVTKGNNLVDQINAAIAKIELCEAAKDKVALPGARLAINFVDEAGTVRPYELRKALDEDAIEKIKAFIMCEFDLQMEDSMKFLDKIGLLPEVITTDKGDVYVDDNSSADDFDIIEEPNIKEYESKKAKKGGAKRKK